MLQEDGLDVGDVESGVKGLGGSVGVYGKLR